MKILLPYSTHFQFVQTEGKDSKNVVLGGVEKFCQDLIDNIEGIIPVSIEKSDTEAGLTKKIVKDAVAEHDPDMIVFNNPWWTNMMLSFNKPLVCLMHEGLVRDIRMIELGPLLKRLNDNGTHIYFMSKRQYEYHVSMSKRINGDNFDFGKIKGFINPSFLAPNLPYSDDMIYDTVTVGRCDILKNPFFLHNKLEKSSLNSLVMTNDGVYKSDAMNSYLEKNRKWKEPRYTFRGLPHNEVFENLSKSKVYCSTCPAESWGITAMESLGFGLPNIFVTDSSNNHSSEIIAADPSHYVKISRKCSSEEFESVARNLIDTMVPRRKEIAEMTREKHSLASWKFTIDNMIDMRYSDKNKPSMDLTEFFG